MATEFFLGPDPITVERLIRDHQRTIRQAAFSMTRAASREKERQARLQRSVNALARAGDESEADLQRAAVELVRSKRAVTRYNTLVSNMNALGTRIATVEATRSMMQTLQGVVAALTCVNDQYSLPEMQTLLAELQRQSGAVDARQSMIDTLSESLADAGAAVSGAPSAAAVADPEVARVISMARDAANLETQKTMLTAPSNRSALASSQMFEANADEIESLPSVPSDVPRRRGGGNDGGGAVVAVAPPVIVVTPASPAHAAPVEAESSDAQSDLARRLAALRQ